MADTATEIALATTTLASPASTITFSSIPQTYTDLRLVLSTAGVDSTSSSQVFLLFNGETTASTNYSYTYLGSNGSITLTGTGSTGYLSPFTQGTTTIPGFFTADIFSYTGSTYKTLLHTYSNDTNGTGTMNFLVRLWRQTSAITSMTIQVSSSGIRTFSTGTIATLYGIL